MTTKAEKFNKEQVKQGRDQVQSGDTIKVYQKIRVTSGKDKNKEKIQIFEGLVLARKHGKGINATITVRKVIAGVGVEKIFPIHSPIIDKIEIVKRGKVKRAKLYYLRTAKGKKARLKRKDFTPTPAEPVEPEATPSSIEPEPTSEPAEPEAKPVPKSEPEKPTEQPTEPTKSPADIQAGKPTKEKPEDK